MMKKVMQRSMVAVAMAGALLSGPVLLASPASAGVPETCSAENAGIVLVPCPPAQDFDRALNVQRLRFTLAPHLRAHLTVTLENGEGQGRHELTVPFNNASNEPVETSWTVSSYDRDMDMRIVRAEWHPGI